MTETWMNKERLAGLLRVWNWLPAFRVVAETEHLPTAAEMLGVTPAALSRTVGLLEEELGRELFRRVGRRLELNPAGDALLVAVRDAMRRAHDGVSLSHGLSAAGPLYVSSSYVAMSAWVVPACEAIAARYPGLVPIVRSVPVEAVHAELTEGGLDVSFQTRPLVAPRVVSEHLADLRTSVWCGPRHPFFDASAPSLAEIQAAPFVVASIDGRTHLPDGWPAGLDRKVGLVLPSMAEGAAAAASGPLLVVLPDALALATHQDLRRVPVDVLPPTPLYAVRRQPLPGTLDLARAMVDEVMGLLSSAAPELLTLEEGFDAERAGDVMIGVGRT